MPILRPISRLLRRPGVATYHGRMRRLSPTLRSPLSFMASAPPSRSPPALARRAFPPMAAPDPAARRVSRFPPGSRSMASTSGFKADESGKPGKALLISSTNDHSAINQGMENVETGGTSLEAIDGVAGKHGALAKLVDIYGRDETGRSTTMDTKGADKKRIVAPMDLLPKSRHRDGSVFRGTHSWKSEYNIADRNETRLPDPTDCIIHNGKCSRHNPNRLLQIFSIKLAKLTVAVGSVELYGYIAVRDGLDPLLNYVVNISRDDPIIVKQGSLINMVGPKRGIDMYSTILVEYDMRIKAGKVANDDHQLIDGVSTLSDLQGTWNRAFEKRIDGDCGAVDLVLARIHDAVLANVEVVVSEVQNSFNLCLRCFIGGYEKEIRLFDGAIGESRGLKRSVVAALHGSTMDLNFEVASEPSGSGEHCCSFTADTHGVDTREIKTEFGLISVKVAWSTLLSSNFITSA
ncbi:uncharacterized protein LOC123407677 [Hordeum vulgare subsp. vulgare]|uniref:uncharacterized protein LOC123407677 n=1 Tax=Hordeum vulgare subsp. vulgare TaxID=112509 RepID=UPI001D1A4138|nr:uncharacterized protein LOC123407677 [Hordeum vulgare subsp. vulgare]